MDLDNDLGESPASPDLSGSQTKVDVKLTEKKRKRKRGKTKSDADDCGTPDSSTSALDMPSEDPIQCVSTDALMTQSCVEADIGLHGNEEKKQKILGQAAEKGNGESEIQDKAGNCNSLVADAELLAKESVLEVVQMEIEQSINENSSNPKETSDSVKNGSPVNNHDEDLKVHDLSNKSQSIKTYSRKKLNDVNSKRNLECPSAENSNKEPIIQDHHNDDSHEVSDGPLTNGLMERETKHLTDQNKVKAEEMELIADNSSEQSSMTTSSIVDIPVTLNGGNSEISQCSVDRTILSNSKNKLLILDVNGLLADCISDVPNGYYQPEPDFWVRRRKVYKRPFCDDFIQFCFDRFHVGVWSSRTKSNVDDVIRLLLGKSASKLLFCWNQSHCTTTKFSTVEKKDKPLVLKELRKLWEKLEPGLPWEKGEFNESNTLLLDDSPYKALVNPKHTAIFPYSYRYHDTRDSALGPKGELRGYLERLSKADNVQDFVSANPFDGQRPIREANPSWVYYLKVIESVKCSENDRPSASVKEETSAPVKEETSAPVTEETSAPVTEETSAQVTEETSAPVTEETSAPVTEETSAPVKEETSAPVTEETSASAPVTEETSAPVTEETSASVKEETSAPVKEETSAPVMEETLAPVTEETSASVKEETSAPVTEETSASVKEETSAPDKEEAA